MQYYKAVMFCECLKTKNQKLSLWCSKKRLLIKGDCTDSCSPAVFPKTTIGSWRPLTCAQMEGFLPVLHSCSDSVFVVEALQGDGRTWSSCYI